MAYRNKMSSASWWLFLAGLGSMTEVHFFGSIALTELAMIVVGPVLFFVNFQRLRHDGFLPFVWLTLLTCLGGIVASKVNHTYWLFALKGLAFPSVYFVATVTFHHFLRRDLSSMKWFLVGAFFSSIVSILFFNKKHIRLALPLARCCKDRRLRRASWGMPCFGRERSIRYCDCRQCVFI